MHWKDARRLRKNAKKKLYAIWLPADLTRIFVNESYCKFFGVEPRQVIGISAVSETAPELREQTLTKLRRVVAAKTTLISTERVALRSGKTALVRWVDTPIVDDTGQVIEVHSVGEPIQDRRKIERRT